ncbi:unnamed protein product [Schistosoma turkestanicum]|nr:unnamed protein product [Schistosoma turkestanicum]
MNGKHILVENRSHFLRYLTNQPRYESIHDYLNVHFVISPTTHNTPPITPGTIRLDVTYSKDRQYSPFLSLIKLLKEIMIGHMFPATSDKSRKLIHTFRWISKYFSTSTEVKDYYDILNVKSTASPEEIKAAYVYLSKKYHPDRCLDDKAKILFAEVSEAYSVLGRSDSRREYDINRKINAFGISADAFRMHYPRPPPDLDKASLEAYEHEMRRRWMEKMTQWAKAQGQYELERGIEIKPASDIHPFIPPMSGFVQTHSYFFTMMFLGGALLLLRSAL